MPFLMTLGVSLLYLPLKWGQVHFFSRQLRLRGFAEGFGAFVCTSVCASLRDALTSPRKPVVLLLRLGAPTLCWCKRTPQILLLMVGHCLYWLPGLLYQGRSLFGGRYA